MKKGKNKEFWKYKDVIKILNKISKDSIVMDVGSGIPTSCYDLERQFQFQKFICLDKAASEKELIDYWIYYYVHPVHKHLAKQLNSFSDCRSSYFNERKLEVPGEFDTKYDVRLNYDISREKITELPRADILLLMNVVHFLPIDEGLNVLKNFTQVLNSEGIVVLWINHYQNHLMANPDHTMKVGHRSYMDKKFKDTCYLFSEKDFIKAVNVFRELNYKTLLEPTKFMNEDKKTIQSMMYIGQRIKHNPS